MEPVTVLIIILIAALLLWLVNTYVPLDGTVRMIMNIVVVVLVVVWVLAFSGVLDHLK